MNCLACRLRGAPPCVLISERGLFRPLFDLAKWVKTMEGRVEVSSDAVCLCNGAYLEAHAPAALLAKIYLSMVSFYISSSVPRGRGPRPRCVCVVFPGLCSSR